MIKYNIKSIIAYVGVLILGLAAGWTVTISFNQPEAKVETKVETIDAGSELKLSESQPEIPVEVVEAGETKTVGVVTVDEVDGGKVQVENDGKTKDELNFGRGEYYDTSSPKAFVDATYGKCIDFDGWFGSQCVDPMAAFMYQEYGRWLSTNDTGAAYGIWDAKEQNAGENMLLVYDKHDIPAGTFAVFYGGQFGHLGLVLGYTDDNHVLLAGENQGGAACEGGGAAVNIINMSLDLFRGGFLPKAWYVEPEPEPEPKANPSTNADGVVNYVYVPGDYFSGVIVRLGLATAHGLWGADGDVAYYNRQLLTQGLVMDDNGRIYGNIPIGSEVVLERRAE